MRLSETVCYVPFNHSSLLIFSYSELGNAAMRKQPVVSGNQTQKNDFYIMFFCFTRERKSSHNMKMSK